MIHVFIGDFPVERLKIEITFTRLCIVTIHAILQKERLYITSRRCSYGYPNREKNGPNNLHHPKPFSVPVLVLNRSISNPKCWAIVR